MMVKKEIDPHKGCCNKEYCSKDEKHCIYLLSNRNNTLEEKEELI